MSSKTRIVTPELLHSTRYTVTGYRRKPEQTGFHRTPVQMFTAKVHVFCFLANLKPQNVTTGDMSHDDASGNPLLEFASMTLNQVSPMGIPPGASPDL